MSELHTDLVDRVFQCPTKIEGDGNPCRAVTWGAMTLALNLRIEARNVVAIVGPNRAEAMLAEGRIRPFIPDGRPTDLIPGRIIGLLGDVIVAEYDRVPSDCYLVAARACYEFEPCGRGLELPYYLAVRVAA